LNQATTTGATSGGGLFGFSTTGLGGNIGSLAGNLFGSSTGTTPLLG
jgi:hypothetical protein